WELSSVAGLDPESPPADSRTALPESDAFRRHPGEVLMSCADAAVERAGQTVVEGVDLDLRAGEILALVGPNGSGKTTLLLGLARLLPSRGVTGGSVGMAFQHPEHQFLTRTVRQELAHGTGTDRSRVSQTLAAFGLAGLDDSDPFRLSGGEQRRLSLAAVASLDRDVLLVDEPTFGQDRRTWHQVAGILESQAQAGKAVVIATHDLRLAGRLADRVLMLADGRPLALSGSERILSDRALLREAGIPPPPLLRWWGESGLPLRPFLASLDGRTA
ncbi:MAG: energy-coupling factor ABC transporter ATP-binding protein, partial [Actinomycetota bacterium]